MAMVVESVLVANRGEIACRVIRTVRRMGLRSIAVFSAADEDASHFHEADTAVLLGPAAARQSYLAIDRLIDAALRTGAQAVHPGYGFLSENADFATACVDAGLVFIGPPVNAIRVMGDKITAKNAVAKFEVPVVPGIARPGLTDADLVAAAVEIGYPVLVKPSAGGGGKGMRRVEEPAELPDALRGARREAAAAFGDDTLFLERFVHRPRHIEVQILADRHGHVVHLGERECSLQRRHQKVVEEAPSPLLDAATRARIGAAACDTAHSVDYVGAGTVEFIVSADRPDEFFFMEMNTRLQVEHPVTEMVTGTDLVEWQIRVAAGEPLGFGQADVHLNGHAIEARVYAEDPTRGFLPTGGRIVGLREPSGPGVRVDSGLAVGTVVGSDYDPMLSKVIAHGADRKTALRRLDKALRETVVLGVVTNLAFTRFLLADEDVIAGRLDTGLLERRLASFAATDTPDEVFVAAAARRWLARWPESTDADPWELPSGWRVGEPAATVERLTSGGRQVEVRLTGTPRQASAQIDGDTAMTLSASGTAETLNTVIDGVARPYLVSEEADQLWLAGDGHTWVIGGAPVAPLRADVVSVSGAELASPMPGTVIAVSVEDGDVVTAGTAVVVVEAMKMEHTLTAPTDGVVQLLVTPGQQVKVDEIVARVVPGSPDE
jgi:acetyl-CoA/propionyl-CoA carboxylase biotin carboxyl carrier protein